MHHAWEENVDFTGAVFGCGGGDGEIEIQDAVGGSWVA